MPEEIISDQGAEFEGELFTELCNSLNASKLRTSPYRPSTNGMFARYHHTLNQMLGKVVGETQRDWDMHVPASAAAYREFEHVVAGSRVHAEFHDARQRSSSTGGHRSWSTAR